MYIRKEKAVKMTVVPTHKHKLCYEKKDTVNGKWRDAVNG